MNAIFDMFIDIEEKFKLFLKDNYFAQNSQMLFLLYSCRYSASHKLGNISQLIVTLQNLLTTMQLCIMKSMYA